MPLARQMAGGSALEQQEFASARRLLEDALMGHRRMGNVHDGASTLRLLAVLDYNDGALDKASARCDESLRMFHALHDPNCAGVSQLTRSQIALARGDSAEGIEAAQAAVDTFVSWGLSSRVSNALEILARGHAASGARDAARRALRQAVEEQTRRGHPYWLPSLLEAIAAFAPEHPQAAELLGFAAIVREQANVPVFPAERRLHASRHEDVRAAQGDAAFDAAIARGRALAAADALARATDVLNDNPLPVRRGEDTQSLTGLP
jgi:tetratricopeptide (TPR) repeat protein